MDIGAFLDAHGIPYQLFEHEAVFTCEESERLPPMPGMSTKNLFLRDRKGTRHFLVVVGHEKNVDLKALKELIQADKLSFASPERLKEHLGVEPGSATLLGLLIDTNHAVEVFLDRDIAEADAIQCHPLRNTATMVIARDDMQAFATATGHTLRVLNVPSR